MKTLAGELATWMRHGADQGHPSTRDYWRGWNAAAGFAQSFAMACDSPAMLAELLSNWATMLEAETVNRDLWTEGRRDAARAAATFVAGWLEAAAS